MFAKPDVQQIIELASSIGFHLSEEEAVTYRPLIIDQLQILDEFVQSRSEEHRPEMLFPDRGRGYRPSLSEDPYRAWMWKCRFGGKDEGVLAGRTVSFKDHISVAGIPQRFGSFALDDFVPDFDATVVTRALRAGATVIGKNVLAGFMGDYGRPISPINADHFTGASSSGSAAALVAGEVDISFGGDQGGSIRIPSAYTGVVGLKPTFGLVSHMGAGFGNDQTVDHIGPMARRVEDVAAALQAVAGYDGYDPRQSRSVPESLNVLDDLTKGVEGLTIGILDEGFDEYVQDEVRDGVLTAIDVLANAGAKIKTISVPAHHSVRTAFRAITLEGSKALFDTSFFGTGYKTFYPASVITAIDKLQHDHIDMLPGRTKLRLIQAELLQRNYHGAVYAKAQNVRPIYVQAYDSALAEVDILAMPTMPTVAPRLDQMAKDLASSEQDFQRTNQNVVPFDYTGHPALAVPCGTVGGLPFSLQLVGRFFDDPLLLRAAYNYQELTS